MPELSIIVPVYNVAVYLNRCVDSILNQTYSDFELLLIDDGSTDMSGVICDEYAVSDSRVKVIHKDNGGVSSARNVGIENSQGKYIMFCDSDDFVHPSWCDVMVREINKNSCSLYCCDIHRIDEKNLGAGGIVDISQIKTKNTSFFEIYQCGLSAYTVNKIYNKMIIKKNNLFFEEKYDLGEDAIFNAAYAQHCDAFFIIDEKLYYYVYYPESLGHRYHYDNFAKHLPIFAARIPLVVREIGAYCDIWLYHFMRLFDNIFDKRNDMKIWQKFRYNQRMIKSKEFGYCLEQATGSKESPLTMKILKMRNYYLFWAFKQVIKIKEKIRK